MLRDKKDELKILKSSQDSIKEEINKINENWKEETITDFIDITSNKNSVQTYTDNHAITNQEKIELQTALSDHEYKLESLNSEKKDLWPRCQQCF